MEKQDRETTSSLNDQQPTTWNSLAWRRVVGGGRVVSVTQWKMEQCKGRTDRQTGLGENELAGKEGVSRTRMRCKLRTDACPLILPDLEVVQESPGRAAGRIDTVTTYEVTSTFVLGLFTATGVILVEALLRRRTNRGVR